MALTDFGKLSPQTKASLQKMLQEFRPEDLTIWGIEFGRGEQTKRVDLVRQPDGTYAPAKRG